MFEFVFEFVFAIVLVLLCEFVPVSLCLRAADARRVGSVAGVLHMFEAHLKAANPALSKITYDIADLYGYVDRIYDISALVFNNDSQMYQPFGRDWIKEHVYNMLLRRA